MYKTSNTQRHAVLGGAQGLGEPRAAEGERDRESGGGKGMGIVLIIVGIAGIVAAIFGKNFSAENQPEMKVPTWFGRLVFFVVGAFFIAGGIKLLFEAN
jgi:hypothetical protein